jgi:carbamoyl-phosphate synthase large subunit
MTESEICILVTGVGGGSLGRELIKSFQMAKTNYKIIATDMSKTSTGLFETKEKYIIPKAESADYIQLMLKICKKEQVKVIVPGSEIEIRQISKNKHLFREEGIEVLCNSLEVFEKCSDKFEIAKFLEKNGFSSPTTLLCDDESELEKIEKFPVIVKPRSGSGSQNVFLAHDMEEVKFFVRYLKKYSVEPLVQEYVGEYTEEYTVGILYADNGRLRTSIAMRRMLEGALSTRQVTIDSKSNKKYVISTGISQGYFDDFLEVRKVGEEIAKTLDSNGPINIQCRKIGTEIIPFEINPRFSGTVVGRSLVNHNEPDIFCRYKLFDEISENMSYKSGYVLRDLKENFYTIDEMNEIPQA